MGTVCSALQSAQCCSVRPAQHHTHGFMHWSWFMFGVFQWTKNLENYPKSGPALVWLVNLIKMLFGVLEETGRGETLVVPLQHNHKVKSISDLTWQTTKCKLFPQAPICISMLPEYCNKHMQALVIYLTVNEGVCKGVVSGSSCQRLFMVGRKRSHRSPTFLFVLTSFILLSPHYPRLRRLHLMIEWLYVLNEVSILIHLFFFHTLWCDYLTSTILPKCPQMMFEITVTLTLYSDSFTFMEIVC